MQVHRQWTNSKLLITKGYGHNLKSAEVLKEVVQFIKYQKNTTEIPTLAP